MNDSPAEIRIRYLDNHSGLPPLERMTQQSSGFDIHAACANEIVIAPAQAALVPAGFVLSMPPEWEAQVRPRSGLALRHSIGILNSPGTIDSDYRGEVGVILYNFGARDFVVRRGDRIAQIVFMRVPPVRLIEDSSLDETGRGAGGFGHTG
jgi:dUTP pyrophosphatase